MSLLASSHSSQPNTGEGEAYCKGSCKIDNRLWLHVHFVRETTWLLHPSLDVTTMSACQAWGRQETQRDQILTDFGSSRLFTTRSIRPGDRDRERTISWGDEDVTVSSSCYGIHIKRHSKHDNAFINHSCGLIATGGFKNRGQLCCPDSWLSIIIFLTSVFQNISSSERSNRMTDYSNLNIS